MSTKSGCTVTCDRCGKEKTYAYPMPAERFNYWGLVKFKVNLGGASEQEYDLCKDCSFSLEDWLIRT